MSLQLVPEQLCSALLVLSECLRQVPGLWEILLRADVLQEEQSATQKVFCLGRHKKSVRRLASLHKPMKPASHLWWGQHPEVTDAVFGSAY
ncbi:hypothetical protein HPG69_016663 [Diceros bicornis minor]|uniref:Uncharacterized protein n=1 Tax=Diceros bicornis minor TaxID=77932 RepID=A0A7J7FPV9_DICBM|nr:hypothetical protein HPG69_016663 [Diceros bicornis minor]